VNQDIPKLSGMPALNEVAYPNFSGKPASNEVTYSKFTP
jgi:hypothetical protein